MQLHLYYALLRDVCLIMVIQILICLNLYQSNLLHNFEEQIEKIIIPSLLNLVKENNEDFHIDCVSVSLNQLLFTFDFYLLKIKSF